MKWPLFERVRTVAFLDQGIVSGGNFITGILMARAFGAYQFGWFTLAWLIVEFVSSLQFAAVLQPMLNIGPKEEEANNSRYYGAVGVQQLGVAIVLAALVWAGVAFAGKLSPDGDLRRLAAPLCVATLAYQAQNFFRRFLFCRERTAAALWNDVLRFALQLGALLLLPVILTAPTAETGIWIVAGACATSSIQGAFSFGRLEWDAPTFYRVLRRHWTFSRWLLPSAVMYWMTSQVFVVMSGVLLGAAVTGSLKAAMSIAGVLNIMLQALDSFAPSQAARALHNGGPHELLRYMVRVAGLTTALMGAAVVMLSINPEALVRLIYGTGYEGVGYLVRWMCGAAMIYSLAALLCIWSAALERTRDIFLSYAVTCIFTIVAAYPLTRYLGLEGVLIGALTVEVTKVVVLVVPFIRYIRRQRRGSGIANQPADEPAQLVSPK